MITARHCLIGLAMLILAHVHAEGSPIQVDLSGYVDGNRIEKSITLSDPSQPLTFDVSSTHLTPSEGPNGYYGGATINSNFSLAVSVITPGSTPAAVASVTIAGPVTGGYSVGWSQIPNMSGSVTGTGTSATLSLPPGVSSADVSPYLADLLAHPSRVSYGGLVTGGYMNMLTTSLSLAPPVDPNAVLAVPEPSTLAVFLTGLAGLALARRRRASRASSARVA